jgi:hypothetical protein
MQHAAGHLPSTGASANDDDGTSLSPPPTQQQQQQQQQQEKQQEEEKEEEGAADYDPMWFVGWIKKSEGIDREMEEQTAKAKKELTRIKLQRRLADQGSLQVLEVCDGLPSSAAEQREMLKAKRKELQAKFTQQHEKLVAALQAEMERAGELLEVLGYSVDDKDEERIAMFKYAETIRQRLGELQTEMAGCC